MSLFGQWLDFSVQQCIYVSIRVYCSLFLLYLVLHASPAVIWRVMELGFVSSSLYQVVLCLFLLDNELY